MVALLTVLAGCGGGGGDDAPASSSSSGNSLVDLAVCVFGGFLYGIGCPDPSNSSGSSGSSGATPTASCTDYYCSGTGGFTYPVDPYDVPETTPGSLDIEPNNELAIASPATIGVLDAQTGQLGFQTDGAVHALNDGVDTYIFTAPIALEITVQLCDARGAVCDEMTPESSLDVGFASVAVLDQDGNSLATTAFDTVNGNLISMPISGGVPYYVAVVSQYKSIDLLPAARSYYLRLVGTLPLAEPGNAPDPAEPALVQPEAPQLTLSVSSQMMATLDWMAPSLNTDGTALVDLSGYALYYGGAEGGPYTFRLPLDLGLSSYTLSLPDYGEWYFVLTAVNAAGTESAFSNEVARFDPPPGTP